MPHLCRARVHHRLTPVLTTWGAALLTTWGAGCFLRGVQPYRLLTPLLKITLLSSGAFIRAQLHQQQAQRMQQGVHEGVAFARSQIAKFDERHTRRHGFEGAAPVRID